MIRAFLLIFDPTNTWDRIEKAQHGFVRVFVLSILPLLAATSAIECYGLTNFGRERGTYVRKATLVPKDVAVRYEVFSFTADLALLFGGAWLLKMIGQGFHRKHSYEETFATTAYSLSPLFLCRALNAVPVISPWITAAVGTFLAVAALYRGIPRIMKPDPSNALGLYIIASLVFILAVGVITFLGLLVLDEKILTELKIVVHSTAISVNLNHA